jgi:multidrug efflux pump subunit AcrA (membrane-fusion protein)
MCRLKASLLMMVLFLSACSGPKGSAKKDEKGPVGKISCSVAKAVLKEVAGSFQANGSFIAENASDIAPAVGGRVAATPVNVGDFVKKGQVICRLEDRDAQLKLDQAKASLEQSKFFLRQAQSRVGWSEGANFNPDNVPEVSSSRAAYESAMATAKLAAADAKRYESLVKSGDVSQSSYEKVRTQGETAEAAANSSRKQYEAQVNSAKQNFGAIEAARAALNAAEAQMAQAQKGLEDTSVRAPFDGYITDRPAAVGQWLSTNSKVATLVYIATVKLQLQIPEQQAGMAKNGMTVTARVAAYPNRDFTGKLIAVVPSVNASSRAFVAEARFDNPKAELRPGMYASAKVMLEGTERAVFVPAKAVFYDNTTDANHVFTVVDGKARLNVVLKGDNDGEQVRILGGLTGNETVILNNQVELYDGATVDIH